MKHKTHALLVLVILQLLLVSCGFKTSSFSENKSKPSIYQIFEYVITPVDSNTDKSKRLTFHKTYSSTGNIIEYKSYKRNGGLRVFSKYFYSNPSKFDSVVSYNSEGDKLKKNIYYYGKDNIIDSINVFDNKGVLISQQFNKYHHNRLISLRSNFFKQKTNFQTNYSYNKKGHLKSSVMYSDSPYFGSKRTYFRNREGKVLIEVFEKNKTEKKKYYKYDDTNNIVELKVVSTGKKYPDIFTYRYTFDKYQNWISKLTYLNGVLNSIEERVISYY
ncbi:hypothetical protein [Winogradskyella algicola]|uniref:hypothetical protein n=1 Tax=Winogradskyella algicola TaxID=2575815 RepID=UPI0011086B65|nr:hypothetical protein [Winogradskyella algicola]